MFDDEYYFDEDDYTPELTVIAEALGKELIIDDDFNETICCDNMDIYYSADYAPDYIEVGTTKDLSYWTLPPECEFGQDTTNIRIPSWWDKDVILEIIRKIEQEVK